MWITFVGTMLLFANIYAQDVCVTCRDGSKSICKDGQFWCGIQNPNCSVGSSTDGCPLGTRRQELSLDERATRSILNSIGHQGARVWVGDQLLTGKNLLDAVVGAMEPGIDRDHVAESYANNKNNINPFTVEALRRCQLEFPIVDMNKHMTYVCRAQGKTDVIKGKLQISDIEGIRHEFSVAESNDDRVRNTIYCYNETQVRQLVQANCQ